MFRRLTLGGIVAAVVLLLYVLFIPWFLHYHAARTHGHHHGGLVSGFFQGFYIVVGIIWHFLINHHIAVWQGPTVTVGYLVAFILGFVAFLWAVARVRDEF
jgi:hypothetical protein